MQIIVTNKGNKNKPSKGTVFFLAISGILILILSSYYYYNYHSFVAFVIIPFWFLLLLKFVFFAPKNSFVSYTNGHVLHVDFTDTAENTRAICRLEVLLNGVRSYSLHSFLKNKPELL